MCVIQIPGNLRSSLWRPKNAILPGGVVSRMKGTEVGSAGIQEVSSCFFSRYISTEVHHSIHSPRWIKSWLKSPVIRHWRETLGKRVKKMHCMLFILLPIVLTSPSQTFGCSVSHLVRNFNCLSATACSAQGEPASSGVLEWVQMQLGELDSSATVGDTHAVS